MAKLTPSGDSVSLKPVLGVFPPNMNRLGVLYPDTQPISKTPEVKQSPSDWWQEQKQTYSNSTEPMPSQNPYVEAGKNAWEAAKTYDKERGKDIASNFSQDSVDPLTHKRLGDAFPMDETERKERQERGLRAMGSMAGTLSDVSGVVSGVAKGGGLVNFDPKVGKLNNLNPTGSLYVDYDPAVRANAPLGENMTTLDKTMGKNPDTKITIYRGAPKSQSGIVPGDFITTNKELAKSYTGNGNVLEKEVRLGDILDDVTEPLGDQYIYRPSAPSLSPPASLQPLVEEAKKYKTAEEFVKAMDRGKDSLATGKYGPSTLAPTEVGSWPVSTIFKGKSGDFPNGFEDLKLSNQDLGFFQSVRAANKSEPIKFLDKNAFTTTIYRVVPEGGEILPGDFVFLNKDSAQKFIEDYGKERGMAVLKKITDVSDSELLLPDIPRRLTESGSKYGFDEFIYAPKEAMKKSLVDLWNKAVGK